MARPPRINFPDALYHVTSRGNGRARIFFADQDRACFLEQFRDGVATAAVALYAFALMDKHFHLLACTPRAMDYVRDGQARGRVVSTSTSR